MEKTIPASVVIITKNEERNIGDALESVKDFEDIVVVDSFSTDRTADICRQYTDRLYLHEWQGYAKQKQTAVDYAAREWVFLLDADERITPELRSEIAGAIKNTSHNGFYVPRKSYFLGKWISHSGWWPDHIVRLFRKEASRMKLREVHEIVIVDGTLDYLKHPIEHHTYRTLSGYINKMENYTTLSAAEIYEKKAHRVLVHMLFSPVAAFFRMYLLRQGFMDGVRGFILAVLYSFYTFLKYAKVWEKRDNGASGVNR